MPIFILPNILTARIFGRVETGCFCKTCIQVSWQPSSLSISVYWCYCVNLEHYKWLGWKSTLYKQDTKNSYADNVRCIFEDNYIFGDNFNTSSRSYQRIFWNFNNKIYLVKGPRDQWLRVEGQEKHIPKFS